MDKRPTGRSKARPLPRQTRGSAGARKLPQEGKSDGGLGSCLSSTHNIVQLYMHPIIYIALHLSFRSTYPLAQTHTGVIVA